MALSLGDKLRTAREERGISISEVAEQTRISPLYLEAIDQNDYKTLPGGIFNKGFVRSYAKFVGVDEQEALQDYSRLMAESTAADEAEIKAYRPEVLTDDRTVGSIVPTIIFAAIILGLMSAGVLFLVNYIQTQQSEPAVVADQANGNTVQSERPAANANNTAPLGETPRMGAVKVEFSAVGEEIWLRSVADGSKTDSTVQPGTPLVFEPKESLDLRYAKARAQFAQLKVNGKPITLPAEAKPGDSSIEVRIDGANLAEIWSSGHIGNGTVQPRPPTDERSGSETTAAQAAATPSSTPASTPTIANSSRGNAAATTPRMTARPRPTEKPVSTPIVVGRPTANNQP
ncbi:MAG: helix-turn-helix domain-containing protein [Pyrinomonadaceae bacterium]